jgi:hypothetical protein
VNFEIAFCVAAIAGTIAYTALRYGELPERVPLHFGLTGQATGFGPRPAVWLIPAVQVIVTVGYAAPSLAGSSRPLLLVGCAIVLFCGYLQTLIVTAALTRANRLPLLRFWIALAILAIAVLLGIVRPH